MATETHSIAPGTCFEGAYEILCELGVGSFGRVLKARQRSTGQDVAIKILRGDERDTPENVENNLQRLRREVRLCSELSHPHIVRLIDSGESHDGLPYVIFEYAPGGTLRSVLETEGKLELGEALRLMIQVLEAISCAHAHGIVHRDLKPENIMVARTGLRRDALVLDFGLGGFVTGASEAGRGRLTASGEMMGTPSYAAPEQLRGAPLSARSDLYSWGLILLECLTGEMAMAGRTAYEVLMKQLGPEPIAIPPWLEHQRLGRLLRAVTAKDPKRGDVTIPALLEALEEIQREATVRGLGAPRLAVPSEGERRQLTVVSCRVEVTDTEGMVVELEDLDQVLGAYETLCLRLAGEAGATIVRAQPGEMQVAFGHPRVQENDARRAVRLALRILAESKALAAAVCGGLLAHVRLGAHSGVGIVRKPSEDPTSDGSYEIVGAPPQLASMLVGLAAPGELLITVDTRALLREEMECELVRDVERPGRAGRVAVFRVVGERSGALLETLTRPSESPFVGRTGELAQLSQLWRRAEAGEAGAVFIQGEAGIGKSRLVRELRRHVPAERWASCRCVPEGQGSPLHPVVEWLRAISEPIDRLLMRHGFDLAETLPLFAGLLSVPIDDPAEAGRLSPERRRELTLSLVVSLLVRRAQAHPVVFVMEDLHWADPTTLEFVRSLVSEVRAARLGPAGTGPRLVVVFTARPEFVPPWPVTDVNVLSLGRLSRSEVAGMVQAERAPGQGVPIELVAQIAERSDGVPLFVEEIVQVLRRGDGKLHRPEEREIPATLREILAARLDALSTSARETVQVAAAVGREYRYDLLRAAIEKDEWVIRQDLAELLDAGLVYGRRSSDEEYVFKHALVRDAAYESMVRSTRQRVHRRIAGAIGTRLPELAERQPELPALHLEKGGDLAGAVTWWRRAGDRAFRRAAYSEAAQHLERGLAVLARLPPGPERIQGEVETLITLGTVLLSTRGHSDPEVGRILSRARTMCEEHGVEVSLKILANLMGTYISEGNREATEAFLPRLERLAVESNDAVTRLSGLLPLALYAFWRGHHQHATHLLEEARPLYRTEDFRRYAEEYGWDGGIYAYAYSVWNCCVTGDTRGAETLYEKLVTFAESSFDSQALPLTLAFGMVSAHGRGDVATALERAERLIAIAGEQRLFPWMAVGQCGHGFALTQRGALADGLGELTQGLQLLQMIGTRSAYGYYLTYLAAAQLEARQLEEGLATVREGLALCERDLARVHEPELLRLEGELLCARGDVGRAVDRLRRARDMARAAGAAMWELRAAVSLAEVLVGRGQRAEVREMLAPLCQRLDGTQDFPDLQRARALL